MLENEELFNNLAAIMIVEAEDHLICQALRMKSYYDIRGYKYLEPKMR